LLGLAFGSARLGRSLALPLALPASAVPPKGTPAWDWDKTWRWRMKKTHRPEAENAEKKAEGK